MDRLLLQCLACEDVTAASDVMTHCPCGRSAAWYRDGVLQIHGASGGRAPRLTVAPSGGALRPLDPR